MSLLEQTKPQFTAHGRHHRRIPDFRWTDDKVADLKKMIEAGNMGCTQMANMLGTTKSSVVGKAHRLGIQIRQDTQMAGRISTRKRRSREPGAVYGAKVVFGIPEAEIFNKRKDKPQPKLPDIETIPVPVEQRRTLMTVKPNECKWPYGDPVTPEFYYCGATTVDDRSYCECHHKLSRQNYTIGKDKDAMPRASVHLRSDAGYYQR